jgi:hypothetical protein
MMFMKTIDEKIKNDVLQKLEIAEKVLNVAKIFLLLVKRGVPQKGE